MIRTLEEQMAIAVLKGDRAAAYALADRLIDEQHDRGILVTTDVPVPGNLVDGYEFYHWPEFRALCKRLGLAHHLPTYDTTIFIPVEGVVEITQRYAALEPVTESNG